MTMPEEIHFRIHDVNLLLCCDNREYLDAISLIFSRYKTSPVSAPDLCVNMIHADAFWGAEGNPAGREVLETAMEKIGRRVFVGEGTVYVKGFVRYAGLSARRRANSSSMTYDLIYDQAFLDSDIGRDPYQSCHQLIGIWPLATHLAQRRNMFFLHGGAAAFEDRNIVFCDLQGVGKSTLLLRMLRTPEARFLSDNIYFHDAERVYACPETIRLDAASLELTGTPADLLVDTGRDSDFDRKMYVVNQRRTMGDFVPDLFIMPRFHPDKSAILPAKEDVSDLFMAFSELAMELNAYNQWGAPFLLQDGSFSTKRLAALDGLLKQKPVYHLHIRKGDSPDSLLDLIRSV